MDWKLHKKYCKTTTKSTRTASRITETAIGIVEKFIKEHRVELMIKMVEVCDITGMGVGDMIVELDFTANGEGIIPTMQSPPIFKIAPIQHYIEGSPPQEKPDFLNCDITHNPVNGHATTERVLDLMIKRRNSGNVSSDLMYLFNYANQIQCLPQSGDTPIFTSDTVDAFRSAFHDNDLGPLSKIYSPYNFASIVVVLVGRGILPEGMLSMMPQDMLCRISREIDEAAHSED
mmetsp:Transcript_42947/g.103934  ORF Transcript_42947/g.103934 Transcript_42947/m.103934 type:complete len:232 (+) Transcript_42947:1198-1893(+)